MTESFKMVNDNVLVKPVDAPNKVGTIIMPDAAKRKQTTGKVVEMDGTVYGLVRGDTVLFTAYDGRDVEIDGVEYVALKAKDILAVL